MADVRALVERRLGDTTLDTGMVARALGMSKRQLQKVLQTAGTTFGRTLAEARLQRARTLLRAPEPALTIRQIAYACGFVSQSHFSAKFRDRFGCPPRDVRRAAPAGIHE